MEKEIGLVRISPKFAPDEKQDSMLELKVDLEKYPFIRNMAKELDLSNEEVAMIMFDIGYACYKKP